MKNFDLEAAKKGARVANEKGVICNIVSITPYGPDMIEFVMDHVPVLYDRKGTFRGLNGYYGLKMADDDYLEKLDRSEYSTPVWQGTHRIMTPEDTAKVTFLSPFDESYWRKQYAGMAMQGFMSDSEYKREVSNVCSGLENQMRIAAEMAVIAADALIEELKKEKE